MRKILGFLLLIAAIGYGSFYYWNKYKDAFSSETISAPEEEVKPQEKPDIKRGKPIVYKQAMQAKEECLYSPDLTEEQMKNEAIIPTEKNAYTSNDLKKKNYIWLRKNTIESYNEYPDKLESPEEADKYLSEICKIRVLLPTEIERKELLKQGNEFIKQTKNPVIKLWHGFILSKENDRKNAINQIRLAMRNLKKEQFVQKFFGNYTLNWISDSNTPNYYNRAIEALANAAIKGKISHDESRIFYYWLECLPDASKWETAYNIIKTDSNIDPWLLSVLEGSMEVTNAWNARSAKWAKDVTDTQWKGFHKHLGLARKAFLKAWEEKPERPATASGMISVFVGGDRKNNETIWLWFNRSVNAQMDYGWTYDRMLWGLRPRWIGNYKTMYYFGRKCLDSKRYDTKVPDYFLQAVIDIAKETPCYGWRSVFRRKGVKKNLNIYFEEKIEADPKEAERLKAMQAICALYSGEYEKAETLISEIDKDKCKAHCVFNMSKPIFLKRSWSEIETELKLFTSPNKDFFIKAELYRNVNNIKKALEGYFAILKLVKGDKPATDFVLKQITYIILDIDGEHENKYHPSPLFTAISKEDYKLAAFLIEQGADVNKQNSKGKTPLYYAVHDNSVPMTKYLLDKGADPNLKTNVAWTPLHLAAKYSKNPEICKCLLEKGAKVNEKDNEKWAPLVLAVCYNSPDVVKCLIKHGADVNTCVKANITALNQAIHFGKLENFKILLDNGAGINDADNDNWTPLYRAAMMGRPEMVKILLEKKADINTKCKAGKTALDVAKTNGIKKILKAAGAKSGKEL
jgi:ankyrin repeat protein/uncharacterized protein (DUF2164 family)